MQISTAPCPDCLERAEVARLFERDLNMMTRRLVEMADRLRDETDVRNIFAA